MSDARVERRLAAILAVDVAGYSRLMEADEEGTLAALRSLRQELSDPKIAEHRGRIVKTTGDGLLVEFASVVDAVRCAIEIQRGMAGRNAMVAAERRIEFRIGINLGDIIAEAGDIFGDGVNIAARLEGLAEAGGICVSAAAHEQVRDKIDVAFDDMGEQRVKNIARPIRVFRTARVGDRAQPPLETPLPDRPSIAVLPFQNLSGDPEQEYFADGVVEEIITALSRIRWLFVIARNSSFTYRGQAIDVKRVGRELGVRYVLEGSVRKGGNRVRVTAQLIDATSGVHVWAERYDRDLNDLFAVQDEITASVAGVIEPALAEAEQQRALRKPPERLDAWEAYQRGLWHFYKYGSEENKAAQTFFRQAIALDPNFAPGHYGYALAQFLDNWLYSTAAFPDVIGSSLEEARLAVALDDKDAMAHSVLGWMLFGRGEGDAANAEGRRALALNPNSAFVMGALGATLAQTGHHAEAIDLLSRAMRASPHDPLFWAYMFWTGSAEFYSGDFAAASETMREVIRLRPGHASAHHNLIACLAYLGRLDEARLALDRASAQFPEQLRRYEQAKPRWMRPEDYALRKEGVRLAASEPG
jgi:adenylate cyclase